MGIIVKPWVPYLINMLCILMIAIISLIVSTLKCSQQSLHREIEEFWTESEKFSLRSKESLLSLMRQHRGLFYLDRENNWQGYYIQRFFQFQLDRAKKIIGVYLVRYQILHSLQFCRMHFFGRYWRGYIWLCIDAIHSEHHMTPAR